MSNWIERLAFGWLFPKPISKKEYEKREKANKKSIVGKISTGNYLLQICRYVTKDDVEKKRHRVLSCK